MIPNSPPVPTRPMLFYRLHFHTPDGTRIWTEDHHTRGAAKRSHDQHIQHGELHGQLTITEVDHADDGTPVESTIYHTELEIGAAHVA